MRVEKFDIASIKPHRAILFVGRSGAGKSVCMRDWLRQLAPRYDAFCKAVGAKEANQVIVTAYRNGDHNIGAHSDKPRSIATSDADGSTPAETMRVDDAIFFQARTPRTHTQRFLPHSHSPANSPHPSCHLTPSHAPRHCSSTRTPAAPPSLPSR